MRWMVPGMTRKVTHLPWKAFSFFHWTLAGEVKATMLGTRPFFEVLAHGMSPYCCDTLLASRVRDKDSWPVPPVFTAGKGIKVPPTSQLLCMSPSFIPLPTVPQNPNLRGGFKLDVKSIQRLLHRHLRHCSTLLSFYSTLDIPPWEAGPTGWKGRRRDLSLQLLCL